MTPLVAASLRNEVAPATRIRIAPWTPSSGAPWMSVVDDIKHAGVEHSPQWWTVIKTAYGHTPLYFVAQDEGGAGAVLPAFLLRSRVFGTVVTSMPFLDAGGPCSRSRPLAEALVRHLVRLAGQEGAARVELRCTTELDLPVLARQDKVNLVLSLPDRPEALWRSLDSKVRNQIRKAEAAKLAVEFGGVELLDGFYEPWSVNMRELGSPVHGRHFFRAIFDAFGKSARVALIRDGAVPVGGLIALGGKDRLVVPWASSRREYFAACPNMLLYWETLRAACLEGFRRFEFGRSTRGSGTYHFKRQWGAVDEPLFWYTIPLRQGSARLLSSDGPRGAQLAAAWHYLPLGVTRWIGPPIRKCLSQ
jgi:FemAB-related protein (PEP-CTERM system-associated)